MCPSIRSRDLAPDAEGGRAASAAFRRARQDRILVDRCVAGDAEAWEQLYERYHRALLAAVRLMFGPKRWDANLVEEIVARVWYTVVADGASMLDRFDPSRGCRLSTYLATIAKSEAAAFFRAERRRRRRERIAARPESTEAPAPLDWQRELSEFAAKLTPRERQFLVDFLLAPPNGKPFTPLSATNRWQLRSRIRRKLQRFLRFGE